MKSEKKLLKLSADDRPMCSPNSVQFRPVYNIPATHFRRTIREFVLPAWQMGLKNLLTQPCIARFCWNLLHGAL